VAAVRRLWKSLQPRLDPRRLVFIDETGIATNMARGAAARAAVRS
jgi:hypothetical protein